MKHIEVLLVRGEDEDHVEDVFLRRGDTVLHESAANFNCRLTRPHESLFEMRSISRLDSRIEDQLWYLKTMPLNNTRQFKPYVDAFTELFLCATGFYLPEELVPFD